MKQFWRIIEQYYPWLLLLLGVDCFCSIILWISDIQAFQTLIGLVVLTKHPSVFSDPVCAKQAGDHPPRNCSGFPQ